MTASEPVIEPAPPGVREPAPPGVREPAPPGVREPAADLAFGAFSDHGPWVLDPEQLPWQWDIDRIRRGTRREVPRLLAPGRLPPLARLSRTLVEIGGALAGWMLFEWRRPSSRAGISRRLRTAFERLGSSYVKLGQIVSGGEGLFPDELVSEFKLLRDQVPPEPFADVRAVVEIDLGGSLEELFEWFDETPIAAASIAQVHAARLRTGEEVVVKVQRPRVAQLFRDDIAALSWLAPRLIGRIPVTALANPPALVELFAETVIEELDFRLEAQNMLDIARVLAATQQRGIIVPRPHPTLITKRVLVMERLDGFAFDDVESMQAAGIDTHALLQAGLIASLEGAMIYGVFHGDLHGGNLVVQPDGRTALFDFGMTGRLSEPQRLAFLRLLMFGTTGDQRGQLAALRDLGAFPPDVDLDALARDLDLDGPVKDPTQMSADDLMNEMREVTKKLLGYGARVPKELMLFVKNTMFLNSATAILAPDLDMLQQMMTIYAYFAETHGDRILREVGIDANQAAPDPVAMRAAFLVDSDTETLTFRDLQARRDEVRRKLQRQRERQSRRRRRRGHG
ncbi:MAG TPA: AarF/UbiB family protein [Acidimicrobiia bacterium]|nr:AarF/UbiB family protein [Acidimicrobiia bacterium]